MTFAPITRIFAVLRPGQTSLSLDLLTLCFYIGRLIELDTHTLSFN